MTAALRESLLATKLRVPRIRPDRLARPRLFARLEEGWDRELVLVSAPAGFGKSTLLADWARSARRPVAWVSLDADDNDPSRFWRYVVAAVEQVCPGVEARAAPLLQGLDQPAAGGVVVALVNQLAVQGEAFALVSTTTTRSSLRRSTPVSASCWSARRPPCTW